MIGVDAVLTAVELERLAVLRVAVMAADPVAVKLEVRRADVLALLAAVDRLVLAPRVQSLMVVHGPISPGFLAATMTVHQHGGRWPR